MIEIIANSIYTRVMKKLAKVEQILQNNNIEYKVHLTTEEKNATHLIRCCTSDKIIVIGGDGTLNQVLDNYNDEELIYFPSGSGNDLGRSLNLKKETKYFFEKLNSKAKRYDAGVVNDKKFCVGFDAGYSANVVKKVNSSYMKKYLRKKTYTLWGIWCAIFAKTYKAKIVLENKTIETNKLYLLTVMLHRYAGGGIDFFKNANGHNGKFSVLIMRDMSRIKFIYNMICILLKKQQYLKDVEIFETKNDIQVTTNQKFYQVDGEVIENNKPLTIKCLRSFYKIK